MIPRNLVTTILGEHSARKYEILQQLAKSGPMTVRELAKRVGSATGLKEILAELQAKTTTSAPLVEIKTEGKSKICSVTIEGRKRYKEIQELAGFRSEGGFFYKERENGTISEVYWWNWKAHRLERLK